MTLKRQCAGCGKTFTCEFECGIKGKLHNIEACYCKECYLKLSLLPLKYYGTNREICESRFGKGAVSKIRHVKEKVMFT